MSEAWPNVWPEDEDRDVSWYGFLEDLLSLEGGWEPGAARSCECILLREEEEEEEEEELVLEKSVETFLLLPVAAPELEECLCEEEGKELVEEWWW